MLGCGNKARLPMNFTFMMTTETPETERHASPVPEQSIVVMDDPVPLMVTLPLAACEALTLELQLEAPAKVWAGSTTEPSVAPSMTF